MLTPTLTINFSLSLHPHPSITVNSWLTGRLPSVRRLSVFTEKMETRKQTMESRSGNSNGGSTTNGKPSQDSNGGYNFSKLSDNAWRWEIYPYWLIFTSNYGIPAHFYILFHLLKTRELGLSSMPEKHHNYKIRSPFDNLK